MDALVDALKTIADGSHKSDEALLRLINAVIDRVQSLEKLVHDLVERENDRLDHKATVEKRDYFS